MSLNILIDMHHEELAVSLALLLEKRLGHNVYRQIGLEWYEQDYWMVYNARDTAMQYLGINLAAEWEDIRKKNSGAYCTFPTETAYAAEEGLYLVPDYDYNYIHKAITLDKFKTMKFDLVISSMPAHIERFNRLIKEHQFDNNCKHAFQVGNNWNVSRFNVKNILTSSKMAHPSPEQHSIFYYQEFDTEKYSRVPSENPRSVFNMKHYMSPQDKKMWNECKAKLPQWKWLAHGGGNEDGPIETKSLPNTFQKNGFLWHVKSEGDGFGYNMFHAFASGRPVITRTAHFRGMTAGDFLIHGKTCIDLDSVGNDFAKQCEEMASNHEQVSQHISDHFKSIVNFQEQADRVAAWLENLK